MPTPRTTYLEELDRGLDAAERLQQAGTLPDEVQTSTGVRLKVKKVAPRLIVQTLNQFEEPAIPEIWDDERQRFWRNPEHPDYLEKLKVYQSKQGFALADLCIALGTDLVYTPDSVEGIKSDNWVDDLASAGITFNASKPRLRYAMWIKSVAAPDAEDLELIIKAVMRLSGATQEDVDDAMRGFPGDTERDASAGT